MNQRKLILFTFNLSIFLQVCLGAHAWFVWGLEKGIASQVSIIVFAIIALLYKRANGVILKRTPQTFFILCFFCLAYITSFKLSIPFLLGLFFRVIPLWVLISLPEPSKVLKWVVKAFCIVLVPGIISYFILLFVPNIPGFPCTKDGWSSSYNFWNYGFIIKPMYAYNEASQIRFNSVFLEPGYLGTLVSFLLYAIRFDFKSKVGRILILSEILSFSLAGYILTFVGCFFYRISQRSSIIKILFVFLVCFGFFEFAKYYNDGDNHVNHLIVQRLQPDEEKGFVGNNRTGAATDYYFNQILCSRQLFFGLGADKIARINGTDGEIDKANKIHGAGYKIFIVTHGIVPAILFFLFYWISADSLCSVNRRYSRGFVLLIILTFLQAAYPDSNSWIIPFLLGIMSYEEQFYPLTK